MTPPLGSASAPAGSSAAAQVQALAHSLGFESPEYRFENGGGVGGTATPDLHTVSCFFRNGGRHAGPIGEVRNVFGRKRAREECARLVLGYLEEVRKERLKVAEGLIRGSNGGVVVKLEEEEDESDVFEDAMEG